MDAHEIGPQRDYHPQWTCNWKRVESASEAEVTPRAPTETTEGKEKEGGTDEKMQNGLDGNDWMW